MNKETTTYRQTDRDHNVWQCESCFHLTQFETDGPEENGWKVCPFCGREIEDHVSL